ncbi:hypothetical protein EMCRGX_G022326 [Ephydatia muelleri]
MSTKNSLNDTESQWNDTRDYLTDPALWFDDLPQPFRMIDQLLSGILETAWETIIDRGANRERERGKFRIPLRSKVEPVEAVTGVLCVCGGRGGIVFAGCSDGLRVLRASKGVRPQLVVGGTGGRAVEQLSAAWSGEMQLVTSVGGGALSIFAFTKDRLILVSQLYDGNTLKVESALLASSCSHIAIISASIGAAPIIEVHSLPLQAWVSEVEAELVKQDGSLPGSTLGQGQEPPVNYSKASLVMTVAPPPMFTPCTASDPSQALSSVATQLLSSIGTGEHHLLTTKYLENRRKAFLSQRRDFETPSSSVNNTPGHPVCHLLCCQRQTSHLAVRWEGQSQVLIYKIECPNKGAQVCPVSVHPHAAPITASAVSPDGRVMVVGTKHGVVTFWDHQEGLYRGVVEIGREVVTSLAFTEPSCVAAGTSLGFEIVQLDDKGVWTKTAIVPHSDCSPVKTVISGAQAICCCLTSSGTVVIWDVKKGWPLCQLALPSATVVSGSVQCCGLTVEHALVVGYCSLEGKASLLDYSLPEVVGSIDEMSGSQHDMPENFMEVLEARLCEAIRNGGRA